MAGPKRILVRPGKTPEERRAAIIAMYVAIHGTEPDAQGLKEIDEVLAKVASQSQAEPPTQEQPPVEE